MLLRTSWTPGPAEGAVEPSLVALTGFQADRWGDLPGIWRAGLRLRTAWPRLPGAVGMWLWGRAGGRTCGSVSLWTDEAALHAFVGFPDHVRIMRQYRGRGRLRSATWHTTAGPRQVWQHAYAQLTSSAFWDGDPATADGSPA